ncbi:MAG: type II toxin-antitoxin system RelB/DinJ family antitoxin [Propionibacteriaceae bacterium]|nr:type II toxin-antitoxin system RelB/DinJ family antitoxin [Propionibacteriaceae bacterium]
MKTATLSIRVDPDVKLQAEATFAPLGLTIGEAVNIFLHKANLEGGLPFSVVQPRFNAATQAAMREAEDIIAGRVQARRYSSFDELLADADADD